MNILLDTGIVIVVLLFVFWGVRRGAVRTVIVFIGSIAAYQFAYWAGNAMAKGIYNSFLKQKVANDVGAAITENVGQSTSQTIDQVFETLPNMVNTALENLGLISSAAGTVEDAVTSSSMTEGVIDQAATSVEGLVSPLFIALIALILTSVLFILGMILVRIIARVFNGFCKIPVLRQVNALGGGVIGLLEGVLVVFVFITILSWLFPFLVEDYNQFREMVIDQTLIFKYVYGVNGFTVPLVN